MNSLLKELLLASFPCTLSNLSPGRGGGEFWADYVVFKGNGRGGSVFVKRVLGGDYRKSTKSPVT